MFTLLSKGKKHIAWRKGEMFIIGDLGVVKHLEEGYRKVGIQEYAIIKSYPKDYIDTLKRKAQIISFKDAAYIIARCGIRNGHRVVEGGAGSGSLTTMLLYYTYPDGFVYTYETRKDFAEIARKNVERIPHEHWIMKIGDVRSDVEEREVDAFIVDIPDPWNAINMARDSLRFGGCFLAYVPTYNQMEKTYKKLYENGFTDLEACEIIKRDMHIGELGTRPENVEVAHTGFLISGIKI